MNFGDEDDAVLRGDVLSEDIQSLKDGEAQVIADKAAEADAAKIAALQDGEVPAETAPASTSANEEGEETPEEKAEREREEEAARKKANVRIPKARVDEMVGKANARAEAALAELAELKARMQVAAKPTTDELATLKKEIEGLQDEYENHILDGRKAEAQAARSKLDAKRDAYMEQRIARQAHQAQEATIAKLTYDAELAKMEAAHPQMNPDAENYDPNIEREMGELMQVYIQAGTPPIEALHKAARYVLPKPASAPAAKPAAVTTAEARVQQARVKAAEAAKKQPANLTDLGKDSDKGGSAGGRVDVMKLTQKQFAELDEATIRKHRGDDLE